jgi:hypothetical protein
MNMIRHQAVSEDLKPENRGIMFQMEDIGFVIVGMVENGLTVIPSVSDMVGNIRYDYSCVSGHNEIIISVFMRVKK